MKKIFEPVQMNHLTLNNRLVRSATWEGIAERDGGISDTAYGIYEELAKGGAGGIITGFTSVDINDVYFAGMMRLSDDSLIPGYRKLADIIHREGTPVITQLALGAYYRKMSDGSVRQLEPDDLSTDDIHHIEDLFIQAAVRAGKAGFDGVQIHVAHFFFLSRFVSPAVNHRNDEYGGSTENRARIVVEILRGIRKAAPELHISAKVNCSDFTAGGLEPEEALVISRILSENGIDSIEVSGNGTSVAGIRAHKNEAYFGGFAARLAEEINTPVILVGGLRARDTMEAVLEQTDISAISLSRPLLREPDLPNKFKSGESTVAKCVSCNACYSSACHRCIFRDADLKAEKAENGKF